MKEINPFKTREEAYTASFRGSRKMTDYRLGKIDGRWVGRASKTCQNREVYGGFVVSIRIKGQLIFFDRDGEIPKSLCKKYNLGEII